MVGGGSDGNERGFGHSEGSHGWEARVRGPGREVEVGIRGENGGGWDVAGNRGGGGGGGDGGAGGDRLHGGGFQAQQLLPSAQARQAEQQRRGADMQKRQLHSRSFRF
ncbi:hypothetical protein E2542_SST19800 [Spatholobus suberectus]|nr:hypothetical protein E2542_SST19800 [Spatholobus suberectus]